MKGVKNVKKEKTAKTNIIAAAIGIAAALITAIAAITAALIGRGYFDDKLVSSPVPYQLNGDKLEFHNMNPLPNEKQLSKDSFYVVEYWYSTKHENPVNSYFYVGYKQPKIDFMLVSGSWVISNNAAQTKQGYEEWRIKQNNEGNIVNQIQDPNRILR